MEPENFNIQIVKRFEREDDDQSRVRPAYVNNFQFARIGTEVFLDACVTPVDDLVEAVSAKKKGQEPKPVEMIVLERFVMSIEAFMRLYSAANNLHEDLKKQGALPTHASFVPEITKI